MANGKNKDLRGEKYGFGHKKPLYCFSKDRLLSRNTGWDAGQKIGFWKSRFYGFVHSFRPCRDKRRLWRESAEGPRMLGAFMSSVFLM